MTAQTREPLDMQRLKSAIAYFEEHDVLISVVARRFDIAYSTLYKRIVGREQISGRFSDEEEQTILSRAKKAFSGRNSLSSEGLACIANEILRKKGQPLVCTNWSFGFINRFPEVRAYFDFRRKRERRRAKIEQQLRAMHALLLGQVPRAESGRDALALISTAMSVEQELARVEATKHREREFATVIAVVGASRSSHLNMTGYEGGRLPDPPRDEKTGKRIRRCRACCGRGHNSRSCPIAKLLAEEMKAMLAEEVKAVKEELHEAAVKHVAGGVKAEVKQEL